MSDDDQVWMAVAQQLRDQLTEVVWYSTFQDVVPLAANGEHFQISVPSNHVRDRILTRYLPLVTGALDEIVGRAAGWTSSSPRLPRLTCRTICWGGRHRHSSTEGSATTRTERRSLDEAGLNPRYMFDASSRAPRTSSPSLPPCASPRRRLARTTRCSSTASAGLGKTHLLHAIGHYVHHKYQHHVCALRLHRDVPQRVRRCHPDQLQHGVQASISGHRRPAHRRHPVPREP